MFAVQAFGLDLTIAQHALAGLTAVLAAVKIAALPQQIRGFGHVKAAAVAKAEAEATKLWAAWDKATA